MKGNFQILILILACTGCVEQAKQKESSITELPAVTDSIAANNLAGEDECFNRKMEQWFISFNKFQAEGATMAEADSKALAEAEVEYNKCKEGFSKITSKAKE